VLLIIDPLSRLLLSFRDAVRVGDDQIRQLRGWVEAGGRVVLALPGRPVISLYGMRLEDSPLNETLGSDPDTWVSAALLESDPPPMEWTSADGSVEGRDGLRSTWSVQPDDVDLTPAHLLAAPKGPQLTVFGTPLPKGTSRVASFDAKPLAITKELGAGQVWLVSTSLPFTNLGVARVGGAPFVARLLAQASEDGRRTLVFDEYLHGLQKRRGFLGWVTGTDLLYPVSAVVLLVFLLGWRGAIAPSAPREERNVTRRAKEEFVLSLADIGLRARRYRGAARAIVATHRARLPEEPEDATSGLGYELAQLADRIDSPKGFGPNELRSAVDEVEAIVRRYGAPTAPEEIA
jgi:hypothetical protein